MFRLKNLKSQFLIIFFALLAPSYSQAEESLCDYKTINIVTGERGTTYYEMGKEMQSLFVRNGMPAEVHTTNGSFDNIGRIHKDCLAQIGITQVDALAYLLGSGDADLERVASRLRYLFPLHNEEVHVIAKKEVKSFADLQGSRVSIGAAGSGTAMTARVMLNLAGIEVAEKRYNGQRALDALKSGDIDAMFYVIGYPFALLENNVTVEDGLHILPITDKRVLEIYPSIEIPAEGYSFISAPVQTVAVRSILFTFKYEEAYCSIVEKAAALVTSNISNLKEQGHSKWKDAEIDKDLKGWTQFLCERDEIAAQLVPTRMDPLHVEIRDTVIH